MTRTYLLIAVLGATLATAAGQRSTFLLDDPYERDVITITSVAPLETIVTRCQQVKGNLDLDPANVLNAPVATFQMDAAKLNTGITQRDEHLRGAGWLEVDKFAQITLALKEIKSPATTLPLPPGQPVEVDAVAALTIKGTTHDVPLKLTATLISATDATAFRLPGNLLRIVGEFDFLLSDYGIAVPAPAQLAVANRQSVKVWLLASTERLVPKERG